MSTLEGLLPLLRLLLKGIVTILIVVLRVDSNFNGTVGAMILCYELFSLLVDVFKLVCKDVLFLTVPPVFFP